MLNRTLIAVSLCAALAACDRPQEPLDSGKTAQDAVPPAAAEEKTVSVMPEHFDRMRAEQAEKEEDRLRRRRRN